MKTKVNFRITRDGEIIAVFIEKLINDNFLVYSLYDNMHFEADGTNVNQQRGIIQVNY